MIFLTIKDSSGNEVKPSNQDPFDDIYLFVKIATTGKPGTECTYFYFDENDCGFSGLERDSEPIFS